MDSSGNVIKEFMDLPRIALKSFIPTLLSTGCHANSPCRRKR